MILSVGVSFGVLDCCHYIAALNWRQPYTVLKDDGHYEAFYDIHGTNTSEKYRPSLNPQRGKSLPFYASVQHVKNSGLMLLCDECGMWRLIYATRRR